jgi:dienelactone hydrolase
MGIQVFDTLRGLDYLLTRADVDPGRIGVAGLCQGSEQTWLAAALEDRFQIAVPVCGTTTYEDWARMPSELGVDLSDPSPYVAGILRQTDWHEVNACIAPRPVYIASNSGDNWWPVRGYDRVVATLEQTFGLYGRPEAFQHLRALRSHSMTPFIPELAPWIEQHLQRLPASVAAAAPCGQPQDPDCSMLRYAQRRIARQTEALPNSFADRQAWEEYRRSVVRWLQAACDLPGLTLGEPRSLSRHVADALVTEVVVVPQDQGLAVPITLLDRESTTAGPRPAVILSHDSVQCVQAKDLVEVASALVGDGYLVVLPEHASPHPASRRQVRNLVSLYGVSDTVGLPPLAMRVWDDLAAAACVVARPDVDQDRLAIIGLGVGGVDAAMAAALDHRLAGVAVVGAVTVRDWAESVAPRLNGFDRILPYLPDVTLKTDLQFVYAAAFPRPLLLVDGTDRENWPAAAYQRAGRTAELVYGLDAQSEALTAVSAQSPWGIQEVRDWLRGRFGRPRKTP